MKIPNRDMGYSDDEKYQEHYDKGSVLFDMDRLEEALEEFDKAIELNPEHAWSFGNRAIVLESQGRFKDALHSVERALILSPDDPDFTATRSAVLKQMKEIEDAAPRTLDLTLLDALRSFDGQKALWAIRVGADPQCIDDDGNTPLHLFYRCPDLPIAEKVARELVHLGADIEAKNHVGDTPWVKLQGIKNSTHKAGLTRILEDLGAKRDDAGLKQKYARMHAKRFSAGTGVQNQRSEGYWDSIRCNAVKKEILQRENIHGVSLDKDRIAMKMSMLIEFDSRMRAQGVVLSTTELIDQLERLEYHKLIYNQGQAIKRDFTKQKIGRIMIGVILSLLLFYLIRRVWIMGG